MDSRERRKAAEDAGYVVWSSEGTYGRMEGGVVWIVNRPDGTIVTQRASSQAMGWRMAGNDVESRMRPNTR